MTDKIHRRETQRDRSEAQPRRPSYEKVAEHIEKWANSSGLQKPKLPDREEAVRGR
jgi:hypothetical protein